MLRFNETLDARSESYVTARDRLLRRHRPVGFLTAEEAADLWQDHLQALATFINGDTGAAHQLAVGLLSQDTRWPYLDEDPYSLSFEELGWLLWQSQNMAWKLLWPTRVTEPAEDGQVAPDIRGIIRPSRFSSALPSPSAANGTSARQRVTRARPNGAAYGFPQSQSMNGSQIVHGNQYQRPVNLSNSTLSDYGVPVTNGNPVSRILHGSQQRHFANLAQRANDRSASGPANGSFVSEANGSFNWQIPRSVRNPTIPTLWQPARLRPAIRVPGAAPRPLTGHSGRHTDVLKIVETLNEDGTPVEEIQITRGQPGRNNRERSEDFSTSNDHSTDARYEAPMARFARLLMEDDELELQREREAELQGSLHSRHTH